MGTSRPTRGSTDGGNFEPPPCQRRYRPYHDKFTYPFIAHKCQCIVVRLFGSGFLDEMLVTPFRHSSLLALRSQLTQPCHSIIYIYLNMSDSERERSRSRERRRSPSPVKNRDDHLDDEPRQEFKSFVGGISWDLDDAQLKERKEHMVTCTLLTF